MTDTTDKPSCSVWYDFSKVKPPKEQSVLMWFKGTPITGPWTCVDKIGGRVLVMPTHWAWIYPPTG